MSNYEKADNGAHKRSKDSLGVEVYSCLLQLWSLQQLLLLLVAVAVDGTHKQKEEDNNDNLLHFEFCRPWRAEAFPNKRPNDNMDKVTEATSN